MPTSRTPTGRTRVVAKRGQGKGTFYTAPTAEGALHPRLRIVLQLTAECGHITRRDYEQSANIPTRTAKRDLACLVAKGLLQVEGTGKSTVYRVAAAGR